jgi:prepilin-type N-terminal cleavage/methylation domain-containing protein
MYDIHNARYEMKKSFTLVEILIVVAILGILAAVTMPMVKDYTQQAKESAAKDNLRILRNAIELYAAQHENVPPGYANNNPSFTPVSVFFTTQLVTVEHYLSGIPVNPFNEKKTVKMIGNSEDFPVAPAETDTYGWIYKPAAKTIRLNWDGTDSKGVAYFDY